MFTICICTILFKLKVLMRRAAFFPHVFLDDYLRLNKNTKNCQ